MFHISQTKGLIVRETLAALLWDYCDLCISFRNWQAVKSVVEKDALLKKKEKKEGDECES